MAKGAKQTSDSKTAKGAKGARAPGQGRLGPRRRGRRQRRAPGAGGHPGRPALRQGGEEGGEEAEEGGRRARRRGRPARDVVGGAAGRPRVRLADVDPSSTPGFLGDKAGGEAVMGELQARLGDLQERLYAESKGGGERSVLLVIQGMDTSGKGGIMRHVVGAVDPQGVHITSFKAPSAEEKAPPVPVAHPPGAAHARRDRRLRPQPLRGRPHRAGPRPRAAHDVGRGATRRSTPSSAGRRRRHDRRQGDAAPLRATSRRPASPSGSSGRTSTGSTTPATSTSGRTGPTTWRRTRRSSRSARRMPRRGSSCPPTASGTPGSP